ncbi:NUDIX domain-containing protein [Streptomyces sp. NRRL S-87]|uniref:NUDIX domain-containing protein n=1 Tax=Streptomyces sp. NRRL S-87 TaxID=1463920 RepID=UPI00099D23CF|nr:NUDIX domain-containing protein [Streptomyces sp. NRRL S-87]
MSAAEEILDVVDTEDRVVRQAPRGEVYARGLRHRCVFVQVRDGAGRIFVHRRTSGKLVFPSLYDMFVGGVVGAGEEYAAAALREAEEELGVAGLAQPVPLFKFLYEDAGDGSGDGSGSGPGGGSGAESGSGSVGSWWSYVYEARWDGPVEPQASEVAWHAFLDEAEVAARLGTWEWVPDGLEAYRRLAAFRGDEPLLGEERPPGAGAVLGEERLRGRGGDAQ